MRFWKRTYELRSLNWKDVKQEALMKATILHDEHGHIIAIAQVGDLKAAGSKFDRAGMFPMSGQRVVEVELTDDHRNISPLDLHRDYKIDLASSKIVKKDPAV